MIWHWQLLKNGENIANYYDTMPIIEPKDKKHIIIQLADNINLNESLKNNDEVLINLYASLSNNLHQENKHTISQKQIELCKRGNLKPITITRREPLSINRINNKIAINNCNIHVEFDTVTGIMTTLRINNMDIIYGQQGFIYDNFRWIENDGNTSDTNGLSPIGELNTTILDNGSIIVSTKREGSLCSTDIDYTIYPNGIVDIDATFNPQTANLRRVGLVCAINPGLNIMRYYAYGPWENHTDRLEGCEIGKFHTCAQWMKEPYSKPQTMGNREGLREVEFTNKYGKGIKIETEGNVSFSALPYTDNDLKQAKHQWELQERPFITLHLDAYQRGIGNASCGPHTMDKYHIKQEPYKYKLRIYYVE